jgi:hypothetical protein
MGSEGLAHSPFRHPTSESAFREADRLCRMHGGEFFVLEAKGSASKIDVRIEKYGDDIPF